MPCHVYAHMVRSPHAHARLRSIETTRALALPGVIAVLTGKDAAADGLIRHKHGNGGNGSCHDRLLPAASGAAGGIQPPKPAPTMTIWGASCAGGAGRCIRAGKRESGELSR